MFNVIMLWIFIRRMKVTGTLLILLILGVSEVHCDSHSLRYYSTAVSSPGSGLPVYSVVGYVDDREIENYNSDTRQYLPKTEWMKKVEPEYWERNTQIGKANEPVLRHNVKTLMNRFNKTEGIHILQEMYGCELRDDGTIVEYIQHGYDGREFMYLDTQRWLWIPTMFQAQITTQRWNSPEERQGEIDKIYLENICIEWLKIYINNGREDLEKRVRPEVKVWGHRQSDDVTRLQCLVYGFHPRPVDVKWMRNGVDHVPSDERSPILPHPDGTYQIKIGVEVPTKEGDTYSCHVEHSSLGDETLRVIWELLIRTRWRSLKDTLQRHQRLERESRSGSGAPPKRPYAFARYLDFLKPVLEMRNTEASWEETENQEEEEEEEEHVAHVDEEEGVSFACSNVSIEAQGLDESLSAQEAEYEETEVSTPSTIRERLP